MRTFWGLLWAYWFSERWREAWSLTLAITILTALSSKAGVWLAEASGSLVNSIAQFHDPANGEPLQALLTSAGTLLLVVVVKDAGFTGVRHLFSTTMHRKWRAWLDGRFNAALLDANQTHFHVQHASRDAGDRIVAAPDNIDQRVQESIKGVTGGAIGLAIGVMGVVTSLFFVGQKLLETSSPVEGLQFLGVYGSAILALTAVAIYVPVNTWLAVRLGGLMERLTIRMQQSEGTYRSELSMLLRRSFNVAASRGEAVQREMHGRIYGDIDGTWARLNRISAGYMSFELIYNFVAARFVAYAPGLIPYVQGKIDLKSYVTGAELVNQLIQQCSWFIQVMPAIATLRANAERVMELAEAIEQVQTPREFYGRTGLSEFRYVAQRPLVGLTVRNLELMHNGADALPFLSAQNLRFRPGEWTFLKGESGCGKSCLMKAINGLWPYGRGEIALPDGVRSFYAAQEVKLPHLSLKRVVCLPDRDDAFTDVEVAAALHRAGLGDFITNLPDESRDGTLWDQLLSGGQKQKLVLARILLHRPGLLFLDEASAALDPESRIAFHQAIKDHCAGVTVISVMHEAQPPVDASGMCFYHSILQIADGFALKRPIPQALPTLITAAREASAARRRNGNSPVRLVN